MKLIIDAETERIVAGARNDLILGMILSDGRLLLQVADRVRFPGHKEWLASIKEIHPIAGFSVLAKGGRLTGLFALSSLNTTGDARLPEDWIKQILKHFGTAPDVPVYD